MLTIPGLPVPVPTQGIIFAGVEQQRCLLLAIIVGLFALCAALWSLATPPFESPDETGHARYVNFLLDHQRLPVPGIDAPGEAHQPPLYYALAASVARVASLGPVALEPRRNPAFRWYGGREENKYLHDEDESPPLAGSARTLHWLRLLSVAMGAATVLLVHFMGSGTGDLLVPSMAPAMVAFIPQFTFISGCLNNDNLATLLASATLVCLMRAMSSPGRTATWAGAGVLAGFALLTKFTALTLVPCGLVALWLARRNGPAWNTRAALAFLAPALALPAPLLLRNLRVMGDPLGAAAQAETLPNLLDRKALISSYFIGEMPAVLFRSFWGTFGWMSLELPGVLYAMALVLTAAAVFGLFAMRRDDATKRLHKLLAAAIAIQLIQIVVYNLTFTQAQGRFLFPVIGPICIMMCAGLLQTARSLRLPALSPRGAGVLVAGMVAANLCILRFILVPAYYLVS